jgi:hypothetical protein
MNLHQVLSLKTDPKLIAAVQQAAMNKLNPADLLEQRVSFIYGSIGTQPDGFTKDQVRQAVMHHQGGVLHK